MLSLDSGMNRNEFRFYIGIRIWLLHASISNFELTLPLTFYWQQLAEYVHSSLCNMIRAQNEHSLAAKSGLKVKEAKTTLQIIQFRSKNSYNTIYVFGIYMLKVKFRHNSGSWVFISILVVQFQHSSKLFTQDMPENVFMPEYFQPRSRAPLIVLANSGFCGMVVRGNMSSIFSLQASPRACL
jgi:hypothetical protein